MQHPEPGRAYPSSFNSPLPDSIPAGPLNTETDGIADAGKMLELLRILRKRQSRSRRCPARAAKTQSLADKIYAVKKAEEGACAQALQTQAPPMQKPVAMHESELAAANTQCPAAAKRGRS